MTTPSDDPTLNVALVLRSAILRAPPAAEVPASPLFDDRVVDLDRRRPERAADGRCPTLGEICQGLETMAAIGDVETPCLVAALMQLELVLQRSDLIICRHETTRK